MTSIMHVYFCPGIVISALLWICDDTYDNLNNQGNIVYDFNLSSNSGLQCSMGKDSIQVNENNVTLIKAQNRGDDVDLENNPTLLSNQINCTNYSRIAVKPPHVFFQELSEKNEDGLIIAHLNINFLQNKFEPLATLVQGQVDILIISETKLDESSHGGGLLIYVREDIPCKRLTTKNISEDIEGIFIELNINKCKWLLMDGYTPNKESISYFLSHVSKIIDMYLKVYENII